MNRQKGVGHTRISVQGQKSIPSGSIKTQRGQYLNLAYNSDDFAYLCEGSKVYPVWSELIDGLLRQTSQKKFNDGYRECVTTHRASHTAA